MQAAIYTRISRDREGSQLGVERQRADCEELAARLGWTVVESYSDNDISAYSGRRRPGYEQLVQSLDEGRVKGLIVWHADRLHRSPVELESFIDICDRNAIEVQTVKAGTFDLSTASGKMVARMLGAAARHEVEHSVERQKRAKLQAALDGKFRGGRRAFGFEADGMTLRETEAQAIRDATKRVLSGVSIAQMVREWNDAGLVTAFGGKPWTARTLKKVLVRPRNAALVTHGEEIIGSGRWPAIVDPDDYRALVALLGDPARRLSYSYERKYLGSGVYVCGKCGKKMRTATQPGGRAGRAKTYKCSGGAHLGRVADRLDEYVTELVLGRLSQSDAAIVLEGREVDVVGLQTKRDGIQARLDELAELFAQGAIDGSQLRRGSESLRENLSAVDEELAAARSSSALANLVLSGMDLREAWGELSVDVQGKIVDALMVVTILPAPRGRQPGGGYFDPKYIDIQWRV
ncbi:recombinase family protein [Rhodococcus hoagii]|nr:recombinase family protein [Prescottella equi]NKT03130.1 recombinase family protein [Prescottella equi]